MTALVQACPVRPTQCSAERWDGQTTSVEQVTDFTSNQVKHHPLSLSLSLSLSMYSFRNFQSDLPMHHFKWSWKQNHCAHDLAVSWWEARLSDSWRVPLLCRLLSVFIFLKPVLDQTATGRGIPEWVSIRTQSASLKIFTKPHSLSRSAIALLTVYSRRWSGHKTSYSSCV